MEATMERTITKDMLYEEIEKFMQDEYGRNKTGNGDYEFEIYVDYRDEISDYTIKKAIKNAEKYRQKGQLPDYCQAFEEEIWEHNDVDYEQDGLQDEIEKYLTSLGDEWEESTNEFTNEIRQWIWDNCYWKYPESFLNRDVKVNIMIDSGNWNYDCVCDSILNYCGYYNDICFDADGERNENELEINSRSSLLWLAKQQGLEDELRKAVRDYGVIGKLQDQYCDLKIKKREELEKAYEDPKRIIKDLLDGNLYENVANMADKLVVLKKQIETEIEAIDRDLDNKLQDEIKNRDLEVKNKFVKSAIQEWENLSSHMGTMTFLVTMPLYDFFELKRRVNGERDKRRDNRSYAVSTEEDLKIETKESITIDKSVMCGLYGPWNGAGSLLNIECEKDVEIPLNILFDVSMDGEKTYGYDVNEVYGLCGDAWDAKVTLNFETAN